MKKNTTMMLVFISGLLLPGCSSSPDISKERIITKDVLATNDDNKEKVVTKSQQLDRRLFSLVKLLNSFIA